MAPMCSPLIKSATAHSPSRGPTPIPATRRSTPEPSSSTARSPARRPTPSPAAASAISYHGGTGNDVVLTAVRPGNTIIGTPGEDFINRHHSAPGQPLPTDFADTIFGRGSDDTIYGLGGDDYINGGGGSDQIFGGP